MNHSAIISERFLDLLSLNRSDSLAIRKYILDQLAKDIEEFLKVADKQLVPETKIAKLTDSLNILGRIECLSFDLFLLRALKFYNEIRAQWCEPAPLTDMGTVLRNDRKKYKFETLLNLAQNEIDYLEKLVKMNKHHRLCIFAANRIQEIVNIMYEMAKDITQLGEIKTIVDDLKTIVNDSVAAYELLKELKIKLCEVIEYCKENSGWLEKTFEEIVNLENNYCTIL